jgi:hypothetical protein
MRAVRVMSDQPKGDPMLQRLTLLALIVTLLAPAAAGARAPHKHLSSLSVARGRLAITRYMARGDEGTVGACEAIDPLRVSCVTTEYEPESEEEIQWPAIAVLHAGSQRISVSWPSWADRLAPFSEPAS